MKCTLCKEDKPEEAFAWRNKSKGLKLNYCKQCKNEWDKRPEKKHQRNTRNAKHRRLLKQQVFTILGLECECCGETREEFLTIDHRNGNGNEHRRSLKTRDRRALYQEILNLEIDARENYRTLCWNCNCARGLFGYCPHEKGE